MNVHFVQDNFYFLQMGIGIGFLFFAWYFLKPRDPESNFRVREADLERPASTKKKADASPLAEAKIARNEPLRLGGIRIDGPAHEILGVPKDSSPEVIKEAYLKLMKQYHPDRVGKQGTREWKDAQKIAEAINRARTELLKP